MSIAFANRNLNCKAPAIPMLDDDVCIVNGDRLTECDVRFRANYNGHEHGEESAGVVRICSDIGQFVYDCFKRTDCDGRD